ASYCDVNRLTTVHQRTKQTYFLQSNSNRTVTLRQQGFVSQTFLTLSTGNKPFVTKVELHQNLSEEEANYCLSHMKPYELPSAFDFVEFTRSVGDSDSSASDDEFSIN
uniref:EF-hand Ca insensitive domain-containing protein n=1 Tax=Stegastes partitus TaxID=144197 RepID=A0A3B4ZML6_9TELE